MKEDETIKEEKKPFKPNKVYEWKKFKNMFAPKQPLSGYNLFFKDHYPELKQELGSHLETVKKLG